MNKDVRASLSHQLTAAVRERWGLARADELAEAIAATAETLALVAKRRLDFDDVEPDPGIPIFSSGRSS